MSEKMDSIFLLIVFFNAFLFVVIVANIVTVGDYSQLNPPSCGLSSTSSKPNKNCFQWHKDVLAPIKGNDPVNLTLGDAPWVALLETYNVDNNGQGNFLGYCSGAVIADEWILTAAHCFKPAYDQNGTVIPESIVNYIDINLGYDFPHDDSSLNDKNRVYFMSGLPYIHPEYRRTSGKDSTNIFDLALVKMDKSISNTSNRLIENSICLPEKWSHTDCKNDTTGHTPCLEYVMIGGWGPGNFSEPNPVKMGYWKIKNERNSFIPNKTEEASIFDMKRVGDQYICGGDSGGPVWQYHLGRAVIVGVISTSWSFKGYNWTLCDMGGNGSVWSVSATWVDQEIDWIRGVTGLN